MTKTDAQTILQVVQHAVGSVGYTALVQDLNVLGTGESQFLCALTALETFADYSWRADMALAGHDWKAKVAQ